MQIKISECNVFCRWVCFLCGHELKSGSVIADAYFGENQSEVVCEECIRGGPEKIRRRMIERAERVRQEAACIESLASQAIECPTWADWKELERKIIRERNKANNFSV